MKYKNTIIVHGLNEDHTLHFVNRPQSIECKVYPFGNPKKAETIGYFDRNSLQFVPCCKQHEWTKAKRYCEAILKHAFYKKQNLFSMIFARLKIDVLGKIDIKELSECLQ